ncbi:hypothetical protein CYOC110262_25870 [Cytobacillus oceanisediminis]
MHRMQCHGAFDKKTMLKLIVDSSTLLIGAEINRQD